MIKFSNCELSDRNLQYGGRAGEKRGIIYNGEHWFLKFPKNTIGMNNTGKLSYVTSPLSEYIGSRIYKILGYDVHETELGICFDGKRNKLVCACKDFIKDNKCELLIPYTALRNDTNEAIMERNDSSLTGAANLNEIIFQLDNNTVLSTIKDAKSRFWDVAIIDCLINNNDRNEDNWGVIKNLNTNEYKLAPIYDCGNCFYSKTDDQRISLILSDIERFQYSALNIVSAYENDKGDKITFSKLIAINDPEFRESLKRVVKNFENKKEEILNFINNIEEEYEGLTVISKVRKEYYIKTMLARFEKLKDAVNLN